MSVFQNCLCAHGDLLTLPKAKLPCPFQAVISGLEMWRFLPGVSDPGAVTSSSSTSGKRDQDPNYEKQMCLIFSSVIRIESVIN